MSEPSISGSSGDSSSTLVDLRGQRSTSAVWISRGVTGLLVVILLAAATGMLGVHSRQVSASGGGYRLTVTYAGIARAGLDVPLRVEVSSDHGWGEHVTLSVSREYLTLFESQGFFPDADSSTGDGRQVVFTFDPPAKGQAFVLDYDAYIQPSAQVGTTATVSVLSDDKPVVSVDFRTFLFP